MFTVQVPLAKHSLLYEYMFTLIRFPIQMKDIERIYTLKQPEKERIVIDNTEGFYAKPEQKNLKKFI